MSIADFHQRFMSAAENNVLVESLRRLSLLDDPRAMFEEDPTIEWGYWTPDSGSAEA